jgi:hypothetical protein
MPISDPLIERTSFISKISAISKNVMLVPWSPAVMFPPRLYIYLSALLIVTSRFSEKVNLMASDVKRILSI